MKAIPVLINTLHNVFLSEGRACSVCFGADGSDLPKAFTYGIAILLGATFSILAALGYAMFRIERARAASENEA